MREKYFTRQSADNDQQSDAMLYLYIILIALFLTILGTVHALAGLPRDKEPGGVVKAVLENREIDFPLLKSDIKADIQGDIATVSITQVFTNPTQVALNATYLFPLNENAAVFAMQMEIGDERVTAQIQKKEKAKKIFEKAKSEGKAASLLVQHRPNMFTQNIANLMPGQDIKVTLQYTQTVKRVDDAYELVIPLIVGPRYIPADKPEAHTVSLDKETPRTVSGGWKIDKVPAYPSVKKLNIPNTIDKDRVSIQVNITSPFAIQTVNSKTHALSVEGDDQTKNVELATGSTIDNKDFILRYKLHEKSIAAGLLTHKDQRGGFFSLLLEPPAVPLEKDITPREIVFVLDTSGSMDGTPMNASKTFMNYALKHLRPTDYFRIIRFSNNATEFNATPVKATPENLAAGKKYVDGLRADGGTEITTAINQAFAKPPVSGAMRMVVFLTDGYIGNEAEVISRISKWIGDARIYALGVGSSVNRYLLAEMARTGRGFVRIVDPTENSDDVAIELARKIEAPLLTDISIDWGTLDTDEIYPRKIPDLFKGDSIRIQGRFSKTGKHTITVKGLVNGRRATLPVTIDIPEQNSAASSQAIPLIWARENIADLMREYTSNSLQRGQFAHFKPIEEKVTKLGLEYSLATQWTSFVAVSEKIVNKKPELSQDSSVPLPMVKGVGRKAYGVNGSQGMTPKTQQHAFNNISGGGSSTPEPSTIGGLALLGLLGGFYAYRRRRQIKTT